MGDLPVLEFHYADCEERFLVVVEDIFGDPQTPGSENAPDLEALFARLQRAAGLDVDPSTKTLSRLRIVENGVFAINLMLGREIVLRIPILVVDQNIATRTTTSPAALTPCI